MKKKSPEELLAALASSTTLPGVSPAVELGLEGGEPPALPARSLGRYLLEDELGRGGMGVVYRAFDRDLRRHVALKVVRRDAADPRALAGRFTAEAQLTAQLQHPAILPVYDLGRTDEGELFYTMRLVRGRTLAKLAHDLRADPAFVSEGPARALQGTFTFFRLLEAFVRVCRALAYAHERGVVHRDLKPSNVMVGRFGEVYVMDWGIAKVVGRRDPGSRPSPSRSASASPSPSAEGAVAGPERPDTGAGAVVGTPAYMAPEQGVRAVGPVGPLADVYALGGILYEVLAGRAPRAGPAATILADLALGVPPPGPRTVDPRVPPRLEEICLRALARDPAARPPGAEALAEEVESYLEGRPARPVRPEDAEFLRTYDPAAFGRPSVAVDLVVVSDPPGGPRRVYLTRRSRPPFLGFWALPGGFVGLTEPLEAAARRKLAEEADIRDPDVPIAQVGAFGDPDRDPRTRVIAIAYLVSLAGPPPGPPAALPDDASEVSWFDVAALPDVAFDHARIIVAALQLASERASAISAALPPA